MELLSAGHISPYVARLGVVSAVNLPVGLPLGLFPDAVYQTMTVVLEPGDRLVVASDGMCEREAATIDLVALICETRSMHPREAARFLTDEVVAASGDILSDDATVLVLDWHRGHYKGS